MNEVKYKKWQVKASIVSEQGYFCIRFGIYEKQYIQAGTAHGTCWLVSGFPSVFGWLSTRRQGVWRHILFIVVNGAQAAAFLTRLGDIANKILLICMM